ncbi:MAG: hypothetical protein ACOCQD_03955 [archaeon]
MEFLKLRQEGEIKDIKLLPRQGKDERIYFELLKQLFPHDLIIPQYEFRLETLFEKERYYYDLYFPDAKLIVEFNEPYHNSPKQRIIDERKREIATRILKCQFRIVKPENLRRMEKLIN